MRIAIVDDEQIMRETLAGHLQRYSREADLPMEIVSFPDGEAFLKTYLHDFDFLFLDVDMPGMNGIEVARHIRQSDANLMIFFVTNYAQYAINGYEVDAVDYMLKPLTYFDFSLKFTKALRRWRNREEQYLTVETSGSSVQRLPASQVLYIEVQKHYLCYHALSSEVTVRGKMDDLAEQLRPLGFCRVHRSYLVNLRHVEKLRSTEVIIHGEHIPVGRQYSGDLMKTYLCFLGG